MEGHAALKDDQVYHLTAWCCQPHRGFNVAWRDTGARLSSVSWERDLNSRSNSRLKNTDTEKRKTPIPKCHPILWVSPRHGKRVRWPWITRGADCPPSRHLILELAGQIFITNLIKSTCCQYKFYNWRLLTCIWIGSTDCYLQHGCMFTSGPLPARIYCRIFLLACCLHHLTTLHPNLHTPCSLGD